MVARNWPKVTLDIITPVVRLECIIVAKDRSQVTLLIMSLVVRLHIMVAMARPKVTRTMVVRLKVFIPVVRIWSGRQGTIIKWNGLIMFNVLIKVERNSPTYSLYFPVQFTPDKMI